MAIFNITQPRISILESIERLPIEETIIKPEMVRVQEAQGLQLVFFKDYQRILEAGDTAFLQVINRNGLDIDRVGIVIEEVDAINHPHYLNDAKHYVNPKKVYIRPMSTKRGKKLLEEAIAHFELYDDPTLFDQFLETTITEGELLDNMMNAVKGGLKKGAEEEAIRQKDRLISDAKSGAKKVAIAGLGLLAANKIASHFTKKYADEDARKHPYERSELIKKLRILRGKLPEYESKYQKAEREKWENRGIIGKIIYKIKIAISNIMARLRMMTA